MTQMEAVQVEPRLASSSGAWAFDRTTMSVRRAGDRWDFQFCQYWLRLRLEPS